MAWGNFILDSSWDVSAAITKFRLVKITGVETCGAVTAITDYPVGVAQFGITTAEVAKGKTASVRVLGVSEVEASVAISSGTMCTLEADGRVSALVGASGKRIVGMCVGHPATTAGDRIAMLFLAGLGLA